MKRFASLLFVLALLPVTAFAQPYGATLSGAQEVPGPGDTDGAGIAVVTIDGTTLRYSVLTQGIGAPTAAHIHAGAAGSAGAPVVTLDHNMLMSGIASNVDAALIDQIKANPSGYYINVHTAEFPNGAIRGQLVEVTSGAGSHMSYIPVVGKVRGQAGTNFVTDLRIVNTSAAPANVTLDFFTQNPAGNAAPTQTRALVVAPGEQKVLDDVVGVTLGQNGVLGGLRIVADANVVASARVINDLRAESNGTAGFAVDAAASGATSGTIAFLAANDDYRTNLGYFNPSASPVTLTMVARSSATGGVMGAVTLTVPGFAMAQQPAFTLVGAVPEAQRVQDDFYVTWTSDAPLFVYGAVTDNVTGDAVLNQ